MNKFTLPFLIAVITLSVTNLSSTQLVRGQESLQVVSTSSDTLLSAAKDQYQKGNYQQAIDLSTQAIKANANNINAFYYRGVARLALYEKISFTKENLESIDTDLRRVIELDPSNSDAYYYYGLAYYKYSSNSSKFSPILSIRAGIYTSGCCGNSNRALRGFEKYISISTNIKKEVYFYLADLEIAGGTGSLNDKNIAISYLNKITNKDTDSSVYLLRGLSHTLLYSGSGSGRELNQIENFNRSITIDPNNVYAYYFRGNAYASLKNAQNAIDDYSKAIQIYPNFIQAYEQRAEIYESIGDNESAKRDRDRAKNIKPELN